MEIIKKETQMQPVEVTVEHRTVCDKCGADIKENLYDAFNFELIHTTGTSYPEGGSGEVESIDLCRTCAPALIDLLKANGYQVNTKEWYF